MHEYMFAAYFIVSSIWPVRLGSIFSPSTLSAHRLATNVCRMCTYVCATYLCRNASKTLYTLKSHFSKTRPSLTGYPMGSFYSNIEELTGYGMLTLFSSPNFSTFF